MLAVCVGLVLVVFAPVATAVSNMSFARAASLGFFGLGAFLLVVGFVHGSRGPLRAERGVGRRAGWTRRAIRRATPEERRDAVLTAVAFFAFGIALLALGVLLDERTF